MVRVFVAFVGIFIINTKRIACQMKCVFQFWRSNTGKSALMHSNDLFIVVVVFSSFSVHYLHRKHHSHFYDVTLMGNLLFWQIFSLEIRQRNTEMKKCDSCMGTISFTEKSDVLVLVFNLSGFFLNANTRRTTATQKNEMIFVLINAFGWT